MTEPNHTEPQPDDLAARIAADRTKREQSALTEINELCQRHRVQIIPTFVCEGGAVSHGLKIKAVEH